MAKKKVREVDPISLFTIEGVIDKGDVISLRHVVMARWDDKLNKELMVFFAQGPHINLNEKEGDRFLEALYEYHQALHAWSIR